MPATTNETLLSFRREIYRREDVARLQAFLETGGTFRFHSLDNGLFPAAASASERDVSGYQYVWIRDNIHLAHAHYVWGNMRSAARTAQTLMSFMQSQQPRMRRIVQQPDLADDPMNRPHVRFDGRAIKELAQRWAHAQNDALGYFLWLFCKLTRKGLVSFGEPERRCLTDLVSYLGAVQFWTDRDSGHWEEVRKVSASSIGAVVAGLREFSLLWADQQLWPPSSKTGCGIDDHCVVELLVEGEGALRYILPYESRGPEKETLRRYDAALLFLIYPLQAISSDLASTILQEVRDHLQGAIGVRRYLRDSYWCADYRGLFSAETRTGNFSENMQSRDAYIKPGEEAQWCLFDSIISCSYGLRVVAGQNESENRRLQVHYLNRALKQLVPDPNGSGALLCPEAYFLENGVYVPNDHIPLQWAQANLKLALHWMSITAS